MVYKELAEASFSLNRYAEMKKYLVKMKRISKNTKDVRKEVRISYIIGPNLSNIMKKIFKKSKQELFK